MHRQVGSWPRERVPPPTRSLGVCLFTMCMHAYPFGVELRKVQKAFEADTELSIDARRSARLARSRLELLTATHYPSPPPQQAADTTTAHAYAGLVRVPLQPSRPAIIAVFADAQGKPACKPTLPCHAACAEAAKQSQDHDQGAADV